MDKKTLKHLDLFSGYGGFTIPASKYGIETINFSEIDKYATAVLEYRFPNIKNLGDITKIKPEDLPDVDIITGGSPCQDLSVAGKGAGLDGGRSGLFFCFINLIKEKQPMYFIWENVKGAFSSSKGWDFARVQIEMEQAGYDVWWQLLNAKDFGVPQNRERIFAIGIRKGSGREILFEQISAGQNTKTKSSNPTSDNLPMVAVDITRRAKTGYKLRKENNVGTITSTYYKGIGNAERPGVIVHNLQTDSMVAVDLCTQGQATFTENVRTIKARYNAGITNRKGDNSGVIVHQREDGVTYTVDTGGTQGVELGDMRIRRLTPTECERLMGLEDGWTAKGIMDGKIVDISDTQRYKMCGNGVVVNCVDYIYNLIIKSYE